MRNSWLCCYKRFIGCAVVVVMLAVISPLQVLAYYEEEIRESFDELIDDGFEEPAADASSAFSVRMPESLDFTIDPFEVAGRGQVHSEEHVFENQGDRAVILRFTDIAVTFADGADSILPRPEPFPGGLAGSEKELYLLVSFDRPDIEPVVATAHFGEPISILLNAQGDENGLSNCILSISGYVGLGPLLDWESGDVEISVTIELEELEPQLREDSDEQWATESVQSTEDEEYIDSDEDYIDSFEDADSIDSGDKFEADINNDQESQEDENQGSTDSGQGRANDDEDEQRTDEDVRIIGNTDDDGDSEDSEDTDDDISEEEVEEIEDSEDADDTGDIEEMDEADDADYQLAGNGGQESEDEEMDDSEDASDAEDKHDAVAEGVDANP